MSPNIPWCHDCNTPDGLGECLGCKPSRGESLKDALYQRDRIKLLEAVLVVARRCLKENGFLGKLEDAIRACDEAKAKEGVE